MLQHEDVVKNLAHIHAHINVLKVLKPQSIIELAEVLAIIRPAKRSLLNESKEKIKNEILKQKSKRALTIEKRFIDNSPRKEKSLSNVRLASKI